MFDRSRLRRSLVWIALVSVLCAAVAVVVSQFVDTADFGQKSSPSYEDLFANFSRLQLLAFASPFLVLYFGSLAIFAYEFVRDGKPWWWALVPFSRQPQTWSHQFWWLFGLLCAFAFALIVLVTAFHHPLA